MAHSYTVWIEALGDNADREGLVDYLASETPLSRAEAEEKTEPDSVLARNRDAESARRLRESVREFGGEATVRWTGPDGEQVRVLGFNRVKGSITGGATPADATVAATDGEDRHLAETVVFSDQSYDLHYPVLDVPEFELVVSLLDPSGGPLAEADPILAPEPVEIVDLELTRGDAEPVTGGDDLFKFAVMKPSVGLERPDSVQLRGDTDGELMQTLVAKRETGDRLGMAEAAGEFADSDRFVVDLDSVSLPLASFESALEGINSLADLRDTIETTFGQPAEEVASSDEFRETRERVASSLTAALVDLSDRDGQVERLGDGLRLLSLVKRAAAGDEFLDVHGAVGRAMDRPVALPDDLFPLPDFRMETRSAPSDEESDKAGALARELAQVRTVRDELVASVAESGDGEARDDDATDGSRDDGDDGVARDSGTSEPLSETAVETFEPLTISDPLKRPDDALAALNERERRLGEDLQYALLDGGGGAGGPYSTASLLSESLDGSTEPMGGSLDLNIDVEDVEEHYPSKPHVNPLGVADLHVMRKTLDRYEMGEIAHIENVLEGENRERTHRTLERSEEFVGSETERVKEKKKSLETTERFEMETETKETIEEEREIDTGVEVTASYGPSVDVNAHFDYNQRTAKTESRRTSQRFAREVTEKTVNRIKERVKSKEWKKTVEETEETNVHGIDNSGPEDDDHVIGIYRWLDKYLDAQVFNYGERMLLEFIVPEPAAFFRYSRATDAAESVDMSKPDPPRINEGALAFMDDLENPSDDGPDGGIAERLQGDDERPLRPTDLHAWNFTYYVQQYGADVETPPRKYKIKTKQISKESQEQKLLYQSNHISVPTGYVATQFDLTSPLFDRPDYDDSEPPGLSIDIGGVDEVQGQLNRTDYFELGPPGDQDKPRGDFGYLLPRAASDFHWSESVPISIYAEDSMGYSFQVHVLCERTDESYQKWQLETYKSIVEAYRNERSEYEEQVAAQRIQDGVEISGQNPARNREIERTELKRSMIAMLKRKALYPEAINNETSATSVPEIDLEDIEENADTIRFLEQAFEWTNITYRFYPYFWAKESKWTPLSRLEDSDPTFASFLRAGAARVVVPVRPGYTLHVPYFMRNGKPPSDAIQPDVGEKEYLSIIEDLKEQQNKLPEEERTVGDPWKIKQPTSLVKLQQGGSLDGGGA